MKKSFAKISDSGDGKLVSLFNFALFIFTKPGINLLKKIARRSLLASGMIQQPTVSYNEWIAGQSSPARINKDFQQHIKSLAHTPKITIIIHPCEEKSGKEISKSIVSLTEQSYAHWELITSRLPDDQVPKDDRIKFNDNSPGNTGAFINTSSLHATGDYILFLMPGDVMTPGCLFELIKHINTQPTDILIYTDEDTIKSDGTFITPLFKPGWSPDTLLSRNYVGCNFLVKKELIAAVNRFSEDAGTDCFYDFLLRATETTDGVGHIQQVLFHLPAHTFTTAANEASKKALSLAMARRATPATVQEIAGAPGCYYLNYDVIHPKLVSVIIPTKDNATLLKTAIDSILQKTDYPSFEIILLDNNSTSEEFFNLQKHYEATQPMRFRCVQANFPFNFARLMNLGVKESKGNYILMCNNDIEVTDADWMRKMVSYAQHNKTGAVGVKLLYPDHTIQHAGIVLGGEDGSRHIYANYDRDDNGYCNSLKAVTNYSAVTAACMMCRKQVYNQVGGMDESLAVEYNDIDFCLRLMEHGYYNVYLPQVVLYHYESATRGHPFRSIKAYKQHEHDLGIFKSKWQALVDNDPFYNVNRDIAFA